MEAQQKSNTETKSIVPQTNEKEQSYKGVKYRNGKHIKHAKRNKTMRTSIVVTILCKWTLMHSFGDACIEQWCFRWKMVTENIQPQFLSNQTAVVNH